MEDESGRQVQREFAGTESKSETEALLRHAMEDYEEKKFVAKSENTTVGQLLDMWVEEELKPGNLSNGTVMAYQGTVNRIKQHPIGNRKLKSVTPDHLQAYIDLLSFGGTNPDGTAAKALSKGYLRQYSAVLQGAFRFAVFPKRLISFNPMQYVIWRGKKEDYELFSQEDVDAPAAPTLTHEQFQALENFLKRKIIRPCCPSRLPTTPGFVSARSVPSPGRTSTWTSSISRFGGASATTGQGTRPRSGPPSGRKSEQWTSVTRWRRFCERPKGADRKPPALWGALQPQLLHRGQGERPGLLRGLHPAQDGGGAGGVSGTVLCLSPP